MKFSRLTLLVALAPAGGAAAFTVPHQVGVARHSHTRPQQPATLHMAIEDLEAKLLGTTPAPAEKPKPKPKPAPQQPPAPKPAPAPKPVVEKPAPKPAPVVKAPPAPKPAPAAPKPAPVVKVAAPAAPAPPAKKKVLPPPPPPKPVVVRPAASAETSFDTVVKGGTSCCAVLVATDTVVEFPWLDCLLACRSTALLLSQNDARMISFVSLLSLWNLLLTWSTA